MAYRRILPVLLKTRCILAQRPACRPTYLMGRWHLVQPLQAASIHTSRLLLSEHIITIQDDQDFKERVIGSDTPVIVDFHATWCGPCKILAPRLESIVTAEKGNVILAKVDIDEMSEKAMEYDVEAVPTVLGMKNGKVVDKFMGVADNADLKTFISKLTGK